MKVIFAGVTRNPLGLVRAQAVVVAVTGRRRAFWSRKGPEGQGQLWPRLDLTALLEPGGLGQLTQPDLQIPHVENRSDGTFPPAVFRDCTDASSIHSAQERCSVNVSFFFHEGLLFEPSHFIHEKITEPTEVRLYHTVSGSSGALFCCLITVVESYVL